MSISDYLEKKILDKVFRNTDFTVTNPYCSLHTADPGETGASEVTGGSYARQLMEMDAAHATNGTTQNTNTEDFTLMPAVTVTHVAFWDASSAGNCLWSGALSASKVVNSGDTFRIVAGALVVTLA